MGFEEVMVLQKRLAEIDMLTTPRRSDYSGFPELLLLKLQNLKIKIYQ